ncbi:uncharacterized protein TNCV_2414551 [Trichonephila clavipes]|nr:uncharacterized protein TNCV_2414551 [Trichonephila clavipes]
MSRKNCVYSDSISLLEALENYDDRCHSVACNLLDIPSPTKEESRQGARVQTDKTRETRTTGSKGHSAAEGRPVCYGKTTVRYCPYYLRNRFKEPEGIPGEQRSTGINSLPQNSLRRRSLSMEALDGDPADRTT